MKILTSFGLFLTSEWIWAVTFARPYIFLSMPILLIMLFFVGKARLVPAVLYAFFLPIVTIAAFTLLVHGVLDAVLGIHFATSQQTYVIHPLAATFLLAMIYGFFQWLFFYILSRFYSLPVDRYTLAAILSNLVTLALVYKFMPSL